MLRGLPGWAKRIKTRAREISGHRQDVAQPVNAAEVEVRQWLALRRLHTPMLFRVLPILHAPLRKFSTQAGVATETVFGFRPGSLPQRLASGRDSSDGEQKANLVVCSWDARNSVVPSLISGPRRHKAFR